MNGRWLHRAEAGFVTVATVVAALGLLHSALVAPKVSQIGALADLGAGSVFMWHQIRHRFLHKKGGEHD